MALEISSIAESQKRLRKQLRRRLKDFLGSPAAAEQQQQLCKQLYRQLCRARPQHVLAFVPRCDEVNIWPVLQKLQGGLDSPGSPQLAFARMDGAELQFILYPKNEGNQKKQPLPPLDVLLEDATNGQLSAFWQRYPNWDLLQPADKFAPLAFSQAARSLLLCPGLGFDIVSEANGSLRLLRLGRGGGFYDRTIARLRQNAQASELQVWGLGYTVQRCPELEQAVEPGQDQELDQLFLADQVYAKRP